MAVQVLSNDFARRFLNPKYSDLNVRCGEKSFLLHRAVICSASEVLAIEVDDAVMEGTTRVIEHTRFEADTLDKCFQFLYRDHYTFDPADSMATIASSDDAAAMALSLFATHEAPSNRHLHRLGAHVRVHAAAKHYELAELEQLAIAKFSLEHESRLPLSPEDLILVATVVYGFPSSEPFQQEFLRSALTHRKIYLTDPMFIGALVDREELREFAVNFFQGVASTHETQVEMVMQDFTSEIHRLQSDVQQITEKKKAAHEKAKAQSSANKTITLANANLTQELTSQTASHDHALQERGEWHKRIARNFSTEVAQLRTELQTGKARNQELQAKQLLHNTTKTSLELQRDNARTDLSAAREETCTKSQIIDQLVELSQIEDCRHCDLNFYYYLERYGPNGYLARCTDCRTRHFAGPNGGCI